MVVRLRHLVFRLYEAGNRCAPEVHLVCPEGSFAHLQESVPAMSVLAQFARGAGFEMDRRQVDAARLSARATRTRWPAFSAHAATCPLSAHVFRITVNGSISSNQSANPAVPIFCSRRISESARRKQIRDCRAARSTARWFVASPSCGFTTVLKSVCGA